MKLLLNPAAKNSAQLADRFRALPLAVAVVLAVGAYACSESSPQPSSGTGGSGGQASGMAGTPVTAGTPPATTAGTTSSAGNSAGGMNGGTGGGSAGAATAGAGGSGGASGGSGGGSGGATGGSGGSGGSGGATGGSGGSGGADGFVQLFNGTDFTGWTVSPGHGALYAVDSKAGEPAIHVYPTQADQSNSQPQAALRTNKSYSSYVFHVEYKWGTKRFNDRKQTDRDNGICFHICNDPTKVWPDSLEFQIGSQAWPGDWVTGNIFMLVSATRAQWSYATQGNNEYWSPNGTKKSIGAPASYYKALATSPNQNKGGAGSSTTPATEWNVVELTVHGSKDASYSVNGVVVNGMTDFECQVNGNWQALDRGPIALQAEFAEVYFRNVKIKELP